MNTKFFFKLEDGKLTLLENEVSFSSFANKLLSILTNTIIPDTDDDTPDTPEPEPEDTINGFKTYGDVTNNNGVLGNFDKNNYALLKQPMDYSEPWEMGMKTHYIYSGSGTESTTFIGTRSELDCQGFGLMIASDHYIRIFLSSDGSNWDIATAVGGTHYFDDDIDVWFKVEWTGTEYNVYYSLDGENYVRDINITSSTALYSPPTPIAIGSHHWNSGENDYEYWRGTIDMTSAYININGEQWWTGNT